MEKYLYKDLATLEKRHWWHIAKRKTCLSLISKYNRTRNPKILDIGCGTGQNIAEFSKIGDASGVDFSEEAIKFCRQRGVKAKKASGDNTGFNDQTFQVVTLLDVLEHLDESSTLKEAKRVLTDDGILIITVPAFMWLWSRWDEVLHHKRRYTAKQLKKVLEKNGFEVSKISYMYSFLVIPALVIRRIKSIFSGKDYGSDFKIGSKTVNSVMSVLANIERVIMSGISLPVGTSIVCVAKKK